MEYRRRRKTGYRPKHGGAYPAAIVVFFLFFGVVYALSASTAAGLVAENWVAPLFRANKKETLVAATPVVADSPVIQLAASPSPAVSTRTVQITMPKLTCYALQMGAYESEENARTQAKALRSIGAAGYLYQDGQRCRVLAAGYPEESSLRKVADQLAGEGIESRAFTIESGQRTVTVSGSEEAILAMELAGENMERLLAAFYDAVIRLDTGETDVRQAAEGLRIQAQTDKAALTMALPGEEAEVLAVCGFFDKVAEQCTNPPDGDGQAEASAWMKHAYLSVVSAYCAYAQGE